ncbi:MAG: phosphocarrier protein HPr [Pseudohongiellaceae bacterium]|jgi:phosphocarrier protein HPr
MITKQLTIINKLGLHARAAAKMATLTNTFNCRIKVTANSKNVDGKSVMALMLLAAAKATPITIECAGVDEVIAMENICVLINNFFDEDE